MKWEFPIVRDCSRNTFYFCFGRTGPNSTTNPTNQQLIQAATTINRGAFTAWEAWIWPGIFTSTKWSGLSPLLLPVKLILHPQLCTSPYEKYLPLIHGALLALLQGLLPPCETCLAPNSHWWFSGWVTTDRKILPILNAIFKALLKQYFLYYYLGLILFWICSFGVHFKALNYTLRRNSLIVQVIFSSTLEERIVHGSVNTTVWKVMSYQTKLNWLTDITCNEWVLDSLS